LAVTSASYSTVFASSPYETTGILFSNWGFLNYTITASLWSFAWTTTVNAQYSTDNINWTTFDSISNSTPSTSNSWTFNYFVRAGYYIRFSMTTTAVSWASASASLKYQTKT
jgi:hypothetical protein